MSVQGEAVVAIWNEVALEGLDEFYKWHNREHIPERVGIRGFIRGRRYKGTGGTTGYFTLYETTGIGVLGGAEYVDRLNNPTLWTLSVTRAHFRHIIRGSCDVMLSEGVADGGVILTLRTEKPSRNPKATASFLRTKAAEILQEPGVTALHYCTANDEITAAQFTTRKNTASHPFSGMIAIEAVDLAGAQAAANALLAMPGLDALIDETMTQGIYALEFSLNAPDAADLK